MKLWNVVTATVRVAVAYNRISLLVALALLAVVGSIFPLQVSAQAPRQTP